MAEQPKIGDSVARLRKGSKWHRVESTTVTGVFTKCGRYMVREVTRYKGDATPRVQGLALLEPSADVSAEGRCRACFG